MWANSLRTEKRPPMAFEIWGRKGFGENISCIINAGTILDGDGMIVDFFDEIVDADKKMTNALHVA